MKTPGAKVNLGIALTVTAVLLLGLLAVSLTWYNQAVSLEQSVQAQYRDNQNRYDALWKKIKEAAQVTDRYKVDFRDVLMGALAERAGAGNAKDPLLTFFHESNPGLDDATYVRLQQVIEAGRDDFKLGQTALLDRQRRYRTHLSSFPGAALSGLLGFPRVVAGEWAPPKDSDGDGKRTVLDYDVVTSGRTKKVFEDGKEDEPIKVFE